MSLPRCKKAGSPNVQGRLTERLRQAHGASEKEKGRLWELMNVSIPKPLALRESRYLSDYAGQSSSAIQRYRSFSGEFWTMAEVGAVLKVT